MSLRTWLVGLFGLLLTVAVVQGGITAYRMQAVDERIALLVGNAVPAMDEAHGINALVMRTRLWQFRYIIAEGNTTRRTSRKKVEEFVGLRDAKVAAYGKLVVSEEARTLYDDLVAKLRAIDDDWQRLLSLEGERQAEVVPMFRGPMNDSYLAASTAAQALVELNVASAAQLGSAAHTEQTSALYLTVAGLAVTLVVSLAAMLFAHLRVSRPIGRMRAAMAGLAEGDADTAIPYGGRRDEIGAMAATVEVFRTGLIRSRALEAETAQARAGAAEQRRRTMHELADGFEQAVSGVIGAVSTSASHLTTTARAMTAAATQTAGQSAGAASAAAEASTNVETVAAAAEELGSSVSEIGRQVGASAGLAREAVDEAARTATLVRALSQGASRVGAIVEMITAVASKTNLLALNATIEAARAGEAGRGFAVVAAEVKELANQTARATTEIAAQIGEIQTSTVEAVAAIEGIAGRIGEINGVATAIAAAVEEQGAATQEIARNVAQAAVGTGEVTASISGVADAAGEAGAAAAQVLASAAEMSRQSEHLGSEVDRFLATVRAA